MVEATLNASFEPSKFNAAWRLSANIRNKMNSVRILIKPSNGGIHWNKANPRGRLDHIPAKWLDFFRERCLKQKTGKWSKMDFSILMVDADVKNVGKTGKRGILAYIGAYSEPLSPLSRFFCCFLSLISNIANFSCSTEVSSSRILTAPLTKTIDTSLRSIHWILGHEPFPY